MYTTFRPFRIIHVHGLNYKLTQMIPRYLSFTLLYHMGDFRSLCPFFKVDCAHDGMAMRTLKKRFGKGGTSGWPWTFTEFGGNLAAYLAPVVK